MIMEGAACLVSTTKGRSSPAAPAASARSRSISLSAKSRGVLLVDLDPAAIEKAAADLDPKEATTCTAVADTRWG